MRWPGETFEGTIYAIDPMVDVNGRALRHPRAAAESGPRRCGRACSRASTIRGRTEQEVVLVPESALVPRGGENFVFRVEDGKAVETKVQLGERRPARSRSSKGCRPTPRSSPPASSGCATARPWSAVASTNPARS